MGISDHSIPPSGRILAIDPGQRRIGLALSDPGRVVAQPLLTLEARGMRRDAEAIATIAAEREVSAIVVGLPINMDGSHGPAYREAERLMERVRAATGLPVVGWDERLTSVQAERAVIESGMRREKRRRRGVVDRVAAALILESFLAALPGSGGG